MHVTPMAVHLGGGLIIRQVFSTDDALPLGHRTAKLGKEPAARTSKIEQWQNKETIADQADAIEKVEDHVTKEMDYKPESDF